MDLNRENWPRIEIYRLKKLTIATEGRTRLKVICIHEGIFTDLVWYFLKSNNDINR